MPIAQMQTRSLAQESRGEPLVLMSVIQGSICLQEREGATSKSGERLLRWKIVNVAASAAREV